jgi:hypothetical protein
MVHRVRLPDAPPIKRKYMLKPTSSYRMSKQTKRSLALVIDPHQRGEQRRLMIQAELAAQIKVREKKTRNEPDLGVE